MKRLFTIFFLLIALPCFAEMPGSPPPTTVVVKRSDCSGITSGACLDTDDGKIYVWNGSAVVLVTTAAGAATIDDTKGNGDTGYAWSADKNFDQLALKQPAEATLTDIADGTIVENLVNTANPWAIDEGGTGAATAAAAASALGVGTEDSPQFTGVELGHATDTTLSRSAAGVLAVEGSEVIMEAGTFALTGTYDFSGATSLTLPPIPALTPVIGDPDNFAANFTGANLYGGTFIANAAGTAALPDAGVGMYFSYVLEGANANIIDPLGTGTADTIYMNGLAAASDENITSSTSGAICTFLYRAANTWMATCNGFTEATP